MKKHQFLATLLALVFMISALPITASAAYYCESVTIIRDGTVIYDVDAYMDDDDCVRISTAEDLLKIFPQELKGTIIAYDPWEGILIEDYIDDFGYDYYLWHDGYEDDYGYVLSIDTGKFHNVGNYSPDVCLEYPEFYINGMYTPMFGFYQYLNIDLSQYNTTIFSGNRIYLNNDGNTPVEVVVNGRLIQFPDQQPIVMDPGRTMVPVRTIAEMLGFKVDWDTDQNCAVITQGNNTMRIYPGSTNYLFNGKYYTMDVQPVVLNGRTMVPLRFVAEAFGYTVDFRSGNVLTVFLNSK